MGVTKGWIEHDAVWYEGAMWLRGRLGRSCSGCR